MKITCKGTCIAITLLLAMALGGCSNTQTTQPTENQKKYEVETLQVEGGTDYGIPNPYLHSSLGPGSSKMGLVYASLLEKDETTDVSWLAESWTTEGNVYTFTLFENQTFHDGAPLTTKDVAFTMDYYKEFPPISNPLGAGDGYLVQSYEIVDDKTIVITVADAMADTLVALGSFVILPQHIWETVEDPYAYKGEGYLVGSGAYTATTVDPTTGSYEFTAFEHWINGTPAAERVLFIPVSEPLLAFDNGDIDLTALPPDLREQYLADETIATVEKTNDFGTKMLINYERHPDFLDLNLRKAVYNALDRETIVSDVLRGGGSVGSAGYVPISSAYYAEGVTKYHYDPDSAKAVLSTRADEISLLCSDSPKDLAMAELIRNNLQDAGMIVHVESFDGATRNERVLSGEYDFALVGNGGWGNNPPKYLRTLFSDTSKYTGTNPHYMGPLGYENQALTQLCESQMFECDTDGRKEIFQEIQELVSQEIPLFVIANETAYDMYHTDSYDGWMKTYAYQQASQNRLSYMSR